LPTIKQLETELKNMQTKITKESRKNS
jgi:hypothetical protein